MSFTKGRLGARAALAAGTEDRPINGVVGAGANLEVGRGVWSPPTTGATMAAPPKPLLQFWEGRRGKEEQEMEEEEEAPFAGHYRLCH
jgi:hypothetical protein